MGSSLKKATGIDYVYVDAKTQGVSLGGLEVPGSGTFCTPSCQLKFFVGFLAIAIPNPDLLSKQPNKCCTLRAPRIVERPSLVVTHSGHGEGIPIAGRRGWFPFPSASLSTQRGAREMRYRLKREFKRL